MTFEILLGISIILDLVFGDPRWYPHPVKLTGRLARIIEKISRKTINNAKIAGIFTTVTTVAIIVILVATILFLSGEIAMLLQTVIAVALLYSLIAVKDLLVHSRCVYNHLYPNENITAARRAVGRIVGRDTASLDTNGVARACVETVTENMVDSITAPLFWSVVFSLFAPMTSLSTIAMAAIGMFFYKIINTMDSMFGYKNQCYMQFGWAPARLDDLVNFIPARISAMCIVVSAWILGFDYRNSMRVFVKDRNSHSSPNAGQTEAALAGALNIKLGGPSYYFAQPVEKNYINNVGEITSPDHILKTHTIVLTGAALFFLFLWMARNICIWLAMVL